MIFYHSRVRQKVFALPINKATETFQRDFSKVCTPSRKVQQMYNGTTTTKGLGTQTYGLVGTCSSCCLCSGTTATCSGAPPAGSDEDD